MPILNVLPPNPSFFPEGESHFLIDGPAGALELLTLAAKEFKDKNTVNRVAVICHPHPLHQGSMHNKVVHTLSRAFHHKGIHAVRFNFRGVGKSAGTFGDSVGETEDLQAVLHWLDKVLAKPMLWLAGFSFGAYIAAQGAIYHACQQLFSIAPAVTNQPYASLRTIACPWVVIQGEADEVISYPEVLAWFNTQKSKQQIQLLTLQTSHFFHGALIPLRTLVEEAILL